jgi:beta-xylosidase
VTSESTYTLLEPRDDAAPERHDPDPFSSKKVLVLVALAGLAVLIVAAAAYDAVTISTDHRTRASLQTTTELVRRTRSTLSATNAEVAMTTAARDARRQAASRTTDQIASTQKSLASASQTDTLQSLDVATLHTCLNGVSSAVTAIAAANLQAAVNAITAAASACLTLDSSGGGLVYPFDFPDPFILNTGTEYYAFGTNSAAGNIQILESSDLTHWTTVGDALPHVAAWAQSGATWGPSVLQQGSSYVLYYSALDGTTGDQCISEAVATQPQGPYTDTSQTPLVCQLDLGGSIDPSPYVATDGTVYLTWKSQGANGQPPTLWAQQLTSDGTALAPGSPSALLTPSQSWQGGIVEGPDMFVSGGQYLLFYSANNWQTAAYAIGVANCTGPLGPCTESSNQPLLASQQTISGPGGPSVFTDDQGNLWMAFHAWLPGQVGYPNSRPLFLRRITISKGAVQVGL